MASPTVAARTEYALTTAGTTATPTFTQTTGDYVLIFLSLAVAGTISPGDGFTNLTNVNANFHIIGKKLAGTEGGDVAITTPSSRACAIAYNIQGFHGTQTPEFSTVATATSLNPDATVVTPTGGAKDYLWISAFYQAGEEADDDTWTTAAPTNFTNLLQKTTGIAGAVTLNSSVASAEFASNAASMDAAAFTVIQSLVWRAYTVVVHPVNIVVGTVTDALALSDVLARAGTFLRSIADSVTHSDVAARGLILLRTITDAIVYSDVVNGAKSLLRTTSDSLDLSDIAAKSLIFFRSTIDSVVHSDAVGRVAFLLRVASDATTYSDAVTRIANEVRSTVDSINLTNAPERLMSVLRSAADNLSPAELVEGLKVIARNVSDALGLTETSERALTAVREASDALGLSGALQRTVGAIRSIADAVVHMDVAIFVPIVHIGTEVAHKIVLRTGRRVSRLRTAITSRRRR